MPVQADFPAPSKLLLALETRLFGEIAAYWLTQPWLKKLPKGNGHAVLIIPGFGTDDWHTSYLRRFLRHLGYAAHGWKLGRNTGMTGRVKEGLAPRLKELHDRYESKVTLIGWSLGGVFARELARRQPELVRAVITLGSPFNVSPSANNVDGLFRRANPGFKPDLEGFARRIPAPPGVRCISIYSKSDGVVAWQCSQEEEAANTENLEVISSHFGMGVNPLVLREIAYKLKELSSPA